ncbi:phage DNA ejection protein [Lelliottia wanjuensis]|uniref:Phage DNA ejection protein n=1 Tax=Lelliottia wanjuensis TaxID=3050585 RepID=A0AAP4D2V1_9ENTR|nr:MULTISPECIES: phage DNA ejection protein [unclassified Lelliottia]MDK9364171.1 phage DNA ejection protein [Lelliottia sp. V106_12]MDK9617152.1 phage DNA ejection protein [Lelliottia sp. V106_9]
MAFGSRAAAAIPDYYSAFSGGAKEGIDIANALEKSYQTAFSNEDQRYHALRKRAATEAFSNAWTSGDPDKIQKVMGMFPEYAQDIQKLIGMRDDQHRKDLGTLSMQMKALTDSGDLQGAKALLDKSGSTVDAATAGTLHGLMNKAAAGDQDATAHLSNLFQGITLAALKPKEIMDWGTDQQRLAQQLQQINNQFQLGMGRIDLQRELGAQRNQLGWANLEQRKQWQSMSPAQRNFEYFQTLSPDQQEGFMKFMPGAGLGARMNMQEKRLFQQQIKDTIKGPQQKQYYMQMAEKAMDQLDGYKKAGNKAGAAEAYHNVRNSLARAAMGGNATLNEAQIEQATGLPAFMDEKANTLGLKAHGMPSKMFMDSTRQQIKDDLKNERETIKNQGYQFYTSLLAQDHTPEEANKIINGALAGTAIGAQDWSKMGPDNSSSDGKKDHSGLW